MTDSLGAWSNAPLAYALAEVRTAHLADIKNYQPDLAGRLRDEYPVQRAMQTAKLIATGAQLVMEASPEAAWEFAAPDNLSGVILRPNGLVLHATAYRDTAHFLAQLHRIVCVLAECVPSVFVQRLGLRYVDFVLPLEGEEPEAYVRKELNPDLGLSVRSRGVTGTSLAIYPMDDEIVLSLRYVRGHGKPEMPPDLGMLSLSPSPLMQRPVKEGKATGVLDFDCNRAYSPVERLDPGRVQAQFASIYEISFNAFTSAITKHAKNIWGAKE